MPVNALHQQNGVSSGLRRRFATQVTRGLRTGLYHTLAGIYAVKCFSSNGFSGSFGCVMRFDIAPKSVAKMIY